MINGNQRGKEREGVRGSEKAQGRGEDILDMVNGIFLCGMPVRFKTVENH